MNLTFPFFSPMNPFPESLAGGNKKMSALPPERVFLVDGSGYIFRAYHALPPLTRTSDNLPVGAVAGVCTMLWKLLRERLQGASSLPPTHFALIFDHSSRTFRNALYSEYKAHRPPAPENLRPQFNLVRQAVRAFNIACVEQEGYEADDLIATYARQFQERGAEVLIIGSDKDLMQLITPQIHMFDPIKGRLIREAEVKEKFGVSPQQVIDLQALVGDSSDNVPGVPGIGIKTAAQLIQQYGNLDHLLADIHNIKQTKRRESLSAHQAQIRLAQKLVRLEDQVPLQVPLEDLAVQTLDVPKLLSFLKAMEFNILARRIATAQGHDLDSVLPDSSVALAGAGTGWAQPEEACFNSFLTQEVSLPPRSDLGKGGTYVLSDLLSEVASVNFSVLPLNDQRLYRSLDSLEILEDLKKKAEEEGHLNIEIHIESPHSSPSKADHRAQKRIGGLVLGVGKEMFYLPLLNLSKVGEREEIFSEAPSLNSFFEALKNLLESSSLLKIGHNIKEIWRCLAEYGIALHPCDDILLLSYVLDSGLHAHDVETLIQKYFKTSAKEGELFSAEGRKNNKNILSPVEEAAIKAQEIAACCARMRFFTPLWKLLRKRLVAENMVYVYETLERPMPAVLGRMEQTGIACDSHLLQELSKELTLMMQAATSQVHHLAGQPFNLASPKQIGEILFDTLHLPGGKRTSSGIWSTSASLLQELAEQGSKIAEEILEWRQLAKLKSTYTEVLPHFIHPQTGRLHTCFSLAATATGRLSSSEPNVQNIPIRTSLGRKIRRAFIAAPNHQLISADYSQIELRLVAHIANIEPLKESFAQGEDIHARTASEIFNVPLKDMTQEIRRRAKAINFGILYGLSAFGLAHQLNIGREEASRYIKQYFERFPALRNYIDAMKQEAREKGYVRTLFGRKCHYPAIHSPNPQERALAERAAINAPIQGSAADIIRRAMVRIDAALHAQNLAAKMLLQVHDELIFECPDSEVEPLIDLVTRFMREAPMPHVNSQVPLQVDARAATNWDAAH